MSLEYLNIAQSMDSANLNQATAITLLYCDKTRKTVDIAVLSLLLPDFRITDVTCHKSVVNRRRRQIWPATNTAACKENFSGNGCWSPCS